MSRHKFKGVGVQHASIEILEARTLLSAAPVGMEPSQVRHAYGFDAVSFTNSLGSTVKGDGTGQTIAIVTAYDAPNIFSSVNAFDKAFSINGGTKSLYLQYGKSPTFLTKVTTSSSTPADPGWLWALETSMDVQWAHSIAPGAKILLVEAASDSFVDLFTAVDIARRTPGVSVVSMSWGAPEFRSETFYDSHFTTPAGHAPVTFVAASGDNGAGANWPSASPNVISVGGTSLTLNPDNSYKSETAWSGSGGGVSLYEAKPSYQHSVKQRVLTRITPDVAYVGDPYTGLAVFDTYKNSGWIEVGGTSAGAPQWAGLFAIANQERAGVGKPTLNGRLQVLPALYGMATNVFHDVTVGSNGYSARAGYDLVTGLGTPIANRIIPALQSASYTGGVAPAYAKPAEAMVTLTAAAHSHIAVVSGRSDSIAIPLPQAVNLFAAAENDRLEVTRIADVTSLLGERSADLFSSMALTLE